jgi:hypothetical protein
LAVQFIELLISRETTEKFRAAVTSYEETQPVLGRSTLFWGMLLSAPPNLLVALGLAFSYPLLARGSRRMAKAGYILSLAGLLIPAVIDLITAL